MRQSLFLGIVLLVVGLLLRFGATGTAAAIGGILAFAGALRAIVSGFQLARSADKRS
jgi:hypothetical protein